MARHFPDFLEAYLHHTSGHEGTRKIHLWSCVSILAGALERKVFIPRGFYTLFPNLYVFIIGRSGLIKKSTTTGIAIDLLRELGGIQLMSERLTSASLITQMSQADRKFFLKGLPTRQSALFAYASELSVFLEEVNGNILDLLTTFYDCQPNDSTKPWTYATKNRGSTRIYGPCLNMLAASTKAWLKKCLPRAEQEGGFTSRVLFVVENDPPTNLVAWPEVSANGDHRRKLIADLMQIHAMAGPMSVTPEAKEYFREWYHFHMREVVPMNNDPAFSGYLGRKGDLILKLATVRAVSLSDRFSITRGHIEWAGHELELLEKDMRTAFIDYVQPVSIAIMFEVLEFVRRKHLTTRAEVIETFQARCPTPLIQKAINELINPNGDILLVEKDLADGRGKRMLLEAAPIKT